MKQIRFIVEKTATGYAAYAEDFDNIPVGTTGNTMTELKENIVSAMNLLRSHIGSTGYYRGYFHSTRFAAVLRIL